MGQPYDGTDLSTDPLSIREICRFPRASLRFSALSFANSCAASRHLFENNQQQGIIDFDKNLSDELQLVRAREMFVGKRLMASVTVSAILLEEVQSHSRVRMLFLKSRFHYQIIQIF